MKKMKFVVGSESPIKIAAVKAALGRFGITDAEIVGSDTDVPNVPEQPFGFEETMEGALARADQVWKYFGKRHYAIGIENGLLIGKNGITGSVQDIAVCTVKTLLGNNKVALSQGVVMPGKYRMMSAMVSYTKTAASFLAEEYPECDPKDPHSFLTKGRFSRRRILTDCLEGIFATMPEFKKYLASEFYGKEYDWGEPVGKEVW